MTSDTLTPRGKKRQEPLSNAQCFYLIDLFEDDQDILLSKDKTADTNKKKAKWTEIAEKFSNTAKKWCAAKKRSWEMTGGGAPLPDSPEYIQHVAELYKVQS